MPSGEALSSSSSKDKKSKKRSSSTTESSKGVKKSGVRTKFVLESLRKDYYELKDENDRLRKMIQERLPKAAASIIAECCPPRKKVSSIDELGNMMGSTAISEDEDE
jgi:hypothetical protein